MRRQQAQLSIARAVVVDMATQLQQDGWLSMQRSAARCTRPFHEASSALHCLVVRLEEAKQQCRSGCVRLLGANRCASRILTFTRQAKRMRATD